MALMQSRDATLLAAKTIATDQPTIVKRVQTIRDQSTPCEELRRRFGRWHMLNGTLYIANRQKNVPLTKLTTHLPKGYKDHGQM